MKCLNCGKEFEPTSSRQKHCCRHCKEQYGWRRSNRKRSKDPVARARKNEHSKRYYREHCEEIKLKQKIYYLTGEWRRGRMTV